MYVIDPHSRRGRQIVGAERVSTRADCARRYRSGQSIRTIAATIGRSYGFVRRVLHESGVDIRPRGGGRHRTTPGQRRHRAHGPARQPVAAHGSALPQASPRRGGGVS